MACAKLKRRFNYDDSLDVFGVHGVGGCVGTLLFAVFGSKHFAGGLGDFEILPQLLTQVLASVYTIGLSGAVSVVLMLLLRATIGLRATEDQERTGLDLGEHGEEACNS